MLKSLLRCLSIAMLIVGTMVGAGFASGREVIAFFGSMPSVLSAIVCAVLMFLCCVLFLLVGKSLKCYNMGDVNAALFKKARPAADIFMLVNALIVFGAMLAGMDELLGGVLDIRPAYSIISGVLCAFIAARGFKNIVRVNGILVPVMMCFLTVACALSIDGMSPFNTSRLYMAPVYISMNMVLGGSILTTVNNLNKKEIFISSAVAALIVGGMLALIICGINSAGTQNSQMPILAMALKYGDWLYVICILVIAVSIFTAMLAAFRALYAYLMSYCKNHIKAMSFFNASVVLLAGLIVSNLGFSSVIGIFYPIIGGLGLIYIAAAVYLLFSTRKSKNKARV